MRSKKIKKRILEPDLIYKSKVITRMVNAIMKSGKKSIAEDILYNSLNKISEDRKESLRIFEQAIKNVMPGQEVRSKRVGGATYQVPYPLKHERSEALAIRWIVRAARAKKGNDMIIRLTKELKDAYEGIGDSIKKRDDVHKAAEANRAFAHFARF
ncbi:30S ribosomal protein S7 [candidate division WWE3 bacterium RBG_19FT_COMBO_34_6]|uniref:Small ribosomal subunit protein uS7 n=1 Tax=candidate division WWE3 bacterium RBG_19FT_COMBO_34_6 TaxID=1802612 RepID=A0A1F4UKH5_UNCKA|nr:MAG: 30S ribosomal protein S7 [candidate division WWE3 bacterium RBG_19FT_COMBO_34_6]